MLVELDNLCGSRHQSQSERSRGFDLVASEVTMSMRTKLTLVTE